MCLISKLNEVSCWVFGVIKFKLHNKAGKYLFLSNKNVPTNLLLFMLWYIYEWF